MPSIVAAVSFNPYHATVVQAPVLGSFADMWGVRQESDIILEDGINKKNQQFTTNEFASPEAYPVEHTTRVILHNPYSLTQPLTQVYACNCSDCKPDFTDSIEPMMCPEPLPVDEEDFEVSRFMPPPPPRMDTYDVITACGCPDSDSVVYNMMIRWFSKVRRSQALFPDIESECPAPAPEEYSFVEWCSMVNDWWFLNFEHRQKKPSVLPRPSHHATVTSNPHW